MSLGAATLFPGPDAAYADAVGLRARWRDLVERRLPEAARARPGWPVRLDHCFARILLDHACGGPWRDHVAAPAWRTMPPDRLAAAVDLGEAVLAGRADLAELDRASLAWRGKTKGGKTKGGRTGDGKTEGAAAPPLQRR